MFLHKKIYIVISVDIYTTTVKSQLSIHIYTKNLKKSQKSALFAYTGWRRLIGSPKLQTIFHKRATKHRALLRKMSYKDKGSYESSPPCIRQHYAAGGIYICTCMDGWRDCMETVFCMKTVCVLYEDSMCACTVFVVFMYVCVCKCTYSHALYIWTCIYTHTHNLCIQKNYAAAVYIYMRTCRYLWWLVCVYMYM